MNKVENKNWVLESQKTLEPLSINGLYIHNDGHKKNKNKRINICVNGGWLLELVITEQQPDV